MPDKDASLMARCPECDSRIYFERRPDAGQIIVCPECETSLEVISVSPIRLDWAYEEGERASGGAQFERDEFGDNPFGDLGRGGRDEVDDDGDDEDYSRY